LEIIFSSPKQKPLDAILTIFLYLGPIIQHLKIILSSLLLFTFCTAHSQADTTKIIITDSAVYFKPQITAMYPGGQMAWTRYLLKNLRYPNNAVKNNIQGTVIIQFMVDSNGLSHDITVIGGPEELRAESIRLIKNVGIWVAGIAHGKRANTWKTQLIDFKLESR
jgi:hypothetical protein